MSVRIERAGNRILLASTSPTPGLKHAIPGAYWREGSATWSLPLDLTTCFLLREKFGQRLVIGPALTEWARAAKRERAQAEALAAAADAELQLLPKVAPELFTATETRRYQRSGIRFIADATGRDGRRRAMLADTVGLGKSIQALGAVLEADLPGPFLIVAPKTAVTSTWAKEIRKWLPLDEVITLPDGRAKRDNILNSLANRASHHPMDAAAGLHRTWVVVNPAVIRAKSWFACEVCEDRTKYRVGPVPELDCGHEKTARTRRIDEHTFPQLFQIEWGAVIADESDQMLIRLTGTPNQQRRGMELLGALVPAGGLRLATSGTPFRSKPHQFWSTLNWLDPVRWSGKWRWIQQYWQTGGYSGYEVNAEGFYEEREALLVDELKDVMIRRTRDMVRADLPPRDYPSNVDTGRDGLTAGIYLPMTAKQAKAYQEMSKLGEAELDGGVLSPIGTLAELTRLKQFACAETELLRGELQFRPAGNKYEWLLEFLTSLGLPERPTTKVVIVSQFTRLLNAFAAGIERDLNLKAGRIGMITGEVTGPRREATIDRFEDLAAPLDILFINTKAGGSSITLDAAEVMVLLDETFVADEQEQVEGRIDNRQPERRIVPRSYYYLRSLGTIEEHIAAANAEAKARGEAVLNGAQLARRAKELMGQ